MIAIQGDEGKEVCSGIERGVYAWDEGSGAFSAAVAVDTNCAGGFSDIDGDATIHLAADQLAYSDNSTGISATRVAYGGE